PRGVLHRRTHRRQGSGRTRLRLMPVRRLPATDRAAATEPELFAAIAEFGRHRSRAFEDKARAVRDEFLVHAKCRDCDAAGRHDASTVVAYGRGDTAHLRMVLTLGHRVALFRDPLEDAPQPGLVGNRLRSELL